MILENVETTWNEGARLRFFLNKPNKRGWGVVYLFCQLEGIRVRLSCGVKARIDYWSKGGVRIPFNASKTDRLLHERACKVMEEVRKFVDDKVFSYLCGEKIDLINELKHYTESIMGTKKTIIRFIPIWKQIIRTDYCDNEQTKSTYLGNVGTFENFMREKNIADDIENLTTATIRMYRDWLVASDKRTADRNQQLINYIGNITNRMNEKGYSIDINIKAIPPIKNLLSKEECQESKVALNMDEIEALSNLQFDDSNEREITKRIVRDLFLIQCYGGCRHEDLGLFLSSNSLFTDEEGNKFSVFTPQKTEKKGTTSYVPLNTLYPQLWDLWNKYKNYGNEIKRDRYNRNLRKIAKRANLDREFTITEYRTKKIVEKGIVYDELTSHCGRRTFITNMVRDFGMDAEQIIDMSGHTDTKMVRDIYTSLTKDDKVKKVAKNVKKVLNRTTNKEDDAKTPMQTKPSKSNNYMIDGIGDAIRVLSFLGVELTPKDIEILNFDDLCRMIEMKHSKLMDDFGIDVMELKDLFNFHKPMVVRRALLVKMIEMMIR